MDRNDDLNWEIIASNIAEAREELQQIEIRIANDDRFGEIELQIAMQHAFHHLNFAWNIRHVDVEQYAMLTQADFDRWRSHPSDLQFEDESEAGT